MAPGEPENADRLLRALESFGAPLIANKRGTGRPKDLLDAQLLEETSEI